MGDAIGGDEFEGVEANCPVIEGVFVGWLRRRLCWDFGGCGVLPSGAAEEGFQPDEEDVEVEGFGEIVVRAGLDAFENLVRAGAGGEHEDGSVDLCFAKGADDGEAVSSGQHAVEEDGGDGFGGMEEIREGGVAVGFVMDAVAFGLQVEEKALGEMFFVFDEDDEWGDGVGHCGLGDGSELRSHSTMSVPKVSGNSRSSSRMTTRKATARAKVRARAKAAADSL